MGFIAGLGDIRDFIAPDVVLGTINDHILRENYSQQTLVIHLKAFIVTCYKNSVRFMLLTTTTYCKRLTLIYLHLQSCPDQLEKHMYSVSLLLNKKKIKYLV